MPESPPLIFSPRRKALQGERARRLQTRPNAASYLLADIAEDVTERLAFLRHMPNRSLIIGDIAGLIEVRGMESHAAFDLESPWPVTGFDLIVAALALDTANDLPGALIHLRGALAPGGLALVTMLGAGSLPMLREIMLEADGERPAPRIHPQVDVRSGAQLLQRAGFSDPVTDSRGLDVRYRSLSSLVGDLRAQSLGNALHQRGPALGRNAYKRALNSFSARADSAGRVTEHFELLTLSGWRR